MQTNWSNNEKPKFIEDANDSFNVSAQMVTHQQGNSKATTRQFG
jgi:hypothetical protein